ncbi:uncharacterized protein CXQ87_002738 [Candidozyma duobushaemuli]|uniref:Uncharacterized protein n=1 Tax=Candidozyma duobushaemuli TaxID=1231522 RepID=A0A2V1ABH4_9ASCO|nr:uncharacterized protein CXQ87_002738 [[Candida] duobushaemulonis]PVH14593.1 hypothetical protein CXQ87_002738 [[Candida] duobushaemulonis]
MSDAFNNYCIACDQLCSPHSVYCSDSCRERDEHPQESSLKSADIPSSDSASESASSFTTQELNNSPLLLASEMKESDVRDFSLNYSVSQAPSLGPLASTSHNYRLWLGVL